MQDILIVLADRGHFKAYNVSRNNHRFQKFDLIEDFYSYSILDNMGDTFVQQSGTFGKDNAMMGHRGFGEKKKVEEEQTRKACKLMAGTINHLVKSTRYKEWYLASDKTIHHYLVDFIEPAVKNNLKKELKAGLVGEKKLDLLTRFDIH